MFGLLKGSAQKREAKLEFRGWVAGLREMGWVRILQTLDRGTTLALRAFVWSFAVQIRSVCMHVYTKVLMKCAICRQVFAL